MPSPTRVRKRPVTLLQEIYQHTNNNRRRKQQTKSSSRLITQRSRKFRTQEEDKDLATLQTTATTVQQQQQQQQEAKEGEIKGSSIAPEKNNCIQPMESQNYNLATTKLNSAEKEYENNKNQLHMVEETDASDEDKIMGIGTKDDAIDCSSQSSETYEASPTVIDENCNTLKEKESVCMKELNVERSSESEYLL